ncbi:MAG: PDC sensor domain-containing protein [Gammaproteobacteria bacterium]
MKQSWKDSIHEQREILAESLKEPLELIASQCAPVWGDRDKLNKVLLAYFGKIPNCTYLYTVTTKGIQISDNVGSSGLLPEHFGRDRSERPYMKEAVPAWGYLLSGAYISLIARRPSLTALQVIRSEEDNRTLGYLGADFDLRNLPMTAELYTEPDHWRQIKGDPAIRGTVFQQMRIDSPMDKNIVQAMAILEELITFHGMFQCVVHFSSSRATIWVVDDPFRYRILDQEALDDPDVCFAFPIRPYPEDALMPISAIGPVLETMRKLRMADETFYLRSASINIFNGMLSLTFSCDGSHYMSYREFLEKDLSFWTGESDKSTSTNTVCSLPKD